MNKFRVCQSAIARFVVLSGVLLSTTSLYSEAASGPTPKRISVKQSLASENKGFDSPAEEFSFSIQNYKMNHQSEIHNLHLKVRYRYEAGISDSKYPDFQWIVKDIQGFLKSYPNETSYWEIVNKKLTLMVLKKYPMLSTITIEMQIPPSRLVPYLHSSIVTRRQSKSVVK